MSSFPAIRIEGGLFGSEFLEQLFAGGLPGQKPQDFGLDGKRNLTDEVAAVFADARAQWEVFKRRLERLSADYPATSVTRDAWVIPFLSLLGYELRYNPRAYDVDNFTFAISHRAGDSNDSPPVHIVGVRQELGRVAPTGRPRLAPHSLVQEFLNRSEHLWGIVTNGEILRLLRDSTYIRRQAYVEFDFKQIFEEQRFKDFAVLYRLLHRTRLPRSESAARDCLLERYYQYCLVQGGRVREHLREGVESCLTQLANGFLAHPANQTLRQRLQSTLNGSDSLTPQEFYHQLLRLVYRFLFLLVSEERGLISADPLYREHYSLSRLRRLLDRRNAYTDHDDLWCSLRVLWKVLSDDNLAALLGAAPLNGELFEPIDLDNYSISNSNLLEALWHLAYYQENSTSPPRRVNYAALDVEELGSIYESLLDYLPQIDTSGSLLRFELASGSERRSTGSYYTPPELVNELIHSALEPVLKERLAKAQTKDEQEKAILSIKVLDPAAGSGHFLLAAARRLGKELARIRTGEDEPAPERVRESIRAVVAHCIYGVDKNPLAVELCRVALWLEAHCQGKPLSFLDHHIKCGDSLAGMGDLAVLERGIPDKAFTPLNDGEKEATNLLKKRNRTERKDLESGNLWLPFEPRDIMHELASKEAALEEIPDDSPELIRKKKQQYTSQLNDQQMRKLLEACNLWTAAFFQHFTDSKSPKFITTNIVINHLAGRSVPQAIAEVEVIARRHRFFHWPLEFPEVFEQGGFDVILGNPPFMGGLKISGNLGSKYRIWLESAFEPFKGTADLCAAFFRQAFQLLRPGGRVGMVATNTIGQGDTRESGLKVILSQGGVITFARRFVKWPGQAAVEVNLISLAKPFTPRKRVGESAASAISYYPILDSKPTSYISSRLDDQPEHEPVRLEQNEGKAFVGDFLRGMGFVLEPKEAEKLIRNDPRNAACIFPYLNGENLNSDQKQEPSRYVICFHDWDLEQARQYQDLLKIVEERVKPDREKLKGPGDRQNRDYWWQFGAYRAGMRQATASLRRVLVRSRVSELHALVFVPKGYVYGDATVVFAFEDDYHFGLLQSAVHEVWLRKQASSLRTDIRYTPTDCFDTFPFPAAEYAENDLNKLLTRPAFAEAARLGAEYHEHRRQAMLSRQLGLTKIYNHFHDPTCQDNDIVQLRELHISMDKAVLACYGWDDIDMRHAFYQNDRGQNRFMPCLKARRELLVRLIELNGKIARQEY